MDDCIAKHLDNINAVLTQIPEEHRGVLFERVFEGFNFQENTRRLELAFALLWARHNSETGGNRLVHLLHAQTIAGKEPDSRAKFLPKDEREWKVACLVAATIIQWLPTAVGASFMAEAFRQAGGTFTYELPNTDGYDPTRR